MAKIQNFLVVLVVATLTACGGGGSGGPSFPTANTGTSGGDGSSSGGTTTPPPAAEPPELRDLVADPVATDVARFLTQATFGPTEAEVLALYEDEADFTAWIDAQISVPQSETLRRLDAHMRNSDLDPLDKTNLEVEWRKRMLVSDMLWETFVLGEDQLRQRVAFALSQIFVISDLSDALFNDARGIMNYHDLMAEHAFGNYRELMKAVTLNPMMGEYLSMVRNEKTDLARNIRPDENYARELMQLFTIGLVELNADGSQKLDGEGNPIPTYNQDIIKGFASVFTGWMYANAPFWYWGGWNEANTTEPMKAFEDYHDTQSKTLLNNQVLPAGMTAEQDLDAALDNIFAHDNIAPFVSKQLIQRLVTSNPSPQYVARISGVFDDNGSGVKGDLEAVVRAILLDPEARRADALADNQFGKLKEPVLKFTSLMRAFDVRADQPLTEDGAVVEETVRFFWPGYDYGQRAYGSPSVFNFYRPDYSPANAFGNGDIAAPEFQILTEKNITAASNWGGSIIFNSYDFLREGCEENLNFESGVGCLFARFEDEIEIARDAGELLSHLDMLMLGGQMSSGMRDVLLDHIEPFNADSEQERLYRVAEATYLIWMSPEYAVQR
jgi:uncharacterized protein (DUF1800 family)